MRIRRAVAAAIAFADRDTPHHVNYRFDLRLLISQKSKPDAMEPYNYLPLTGFYTTDENREYFTFTHWNVSNETNN